MGKRYPPHTVLPTGAIMVTPEVDVSNIKNDLTGYFRGTVVLSTPFSVQDFTHYYDDEMGGDITKYFYYIQALREVEGAEQWKIWSNSRENAFSEHSDSPRPVNIDPGYLTLSKLVLFSAKGYSHRIYIRDRIYAEVTLQYMHKEFRSLPWTYKDYRTPAALQFWSRARSELDRLLRLESAVQPNSTDE